MPRHRRGWAMGGGPHREGRHSPLKIAMLEPTLLILLEERSRHGYTLLSELEELGWARSIRASFIEHCVRWRHWSGLFPIGMQTRPRARRAEFTS
jgi:hypothetical protein